MRSAIAYGVVANIMLVPVRSPIKDAALKRMNLVVYIERTRTRCFA